MIEQKDKSDLLFCTICAGFFFSYVSKPDPIWVGIDGEPSPVSLLAVVGSGCGLPLDLPIEDVGFEGILLNSLTLISDNNQYTISSTQVEGAIAVHTQNWTDLKGFELSYSKGKDSFICSIFILLCANIYNLM